MRGYSLAAAICGLLANTAAVAASNATSYQILPSNFKPPQVFKNNNLVRHTNLEKGYVRETVNAVVENIAATPQSQYYVPFDSSSFGNVGGFEVRDKKAAEKGKFNVEATVSDGPSSLQYYIVHLPDPLQPGAQQTISISYHVLSALSPLPASINQNEKQYLTYDLSAYATTAYSTTKQSTKVKLSTTDIPSWTSTEGLKSSKDPERQGSTITYGPYDSAPVEPDTIYPVSIRYEFTKPVLKATKLERDIEVSHWGGNLATEERFWLENIGATLKDSFNRVAWAGRQYYMPQGSSALVELKLPLQPGSVDAYFTDDIGNVSTSHFRPTPSKSSKEALLELKPRYPVFGGWKYSFRAGWNNQLAPFLRKLSGSASSNGDSYVLRVPFIEGPKMAEGLQYEDVTVRIILPEGATDVKYELISTQVGMPSEVTEELSLHKTFMDTVGRTVLTLKAKNVVDDARDGEIIVTYNYSSTAMLRKPVTITASLAALFIVLYTISQLDVSIGKKKLA